MLRGEIRLVDLEPVRGSETNKRRPAVLVSNDHANSVAARLGRGVLTVVPLTTSLNRVFPFQVILPAEDTGLSADSKAQAEQVRAVDVDRIGAAIGRVPVHLMAELDDALQTSPLPRRKMILGSAGFGLGALAFAPYIDKNPSAKPEDRKFAISLFTMFLMACATLTIIGSFFRGPGQLFIFPWTEGLFFEL